MDIAKYAQLPSLPSKTLPFFSLGYDGLQRRAHDLLGLLTTLASRPDTRQCRPFRGFIDFDRQSGSAETLRELMRGRCASDPRFGVIGASAIGDVLAVVHTDTTSLARLGKVWSIIEPDELGTFSLWRISRGSGITQTASTEQFADDDILKLGEKVFSGSLCETAHSMKLSIESATLAIGLANGTIQVYDIQSPLKPEWVIKAHGLSPVIAVDIIRDTVVSIGLDSALRVSSTKTGKMISGGQLSKRLSSGEVFTTLHIHPKSERVFVGTTKGQVFVYDISSGSPQFVSVMRMNILSPIAYISSSEDQILIGYDSFVAVFSSAETPLQIFTIQSVNGTKISACIPIPKTDLIAVGLSDGSLSIYFKSVLVYSRFFAVEKINSLNYSLPDGVLWVGGDDGRVVEAIIPSSVPDDAKFAHDCVLEKISVEAPAPAPLKTTALEQAGANKQLGVAAAPVIKTTKTAALAENDSDDEDWKRGLFTSE